MKTAQAISAYIQYRSVENLSESSFKAYRLALGRFRAHMPIRCESIKEHHVRSWVGALGRLRVRSQAGEVGTVKAWMQWCVRRGYLDPDLLEYLPKIRVPHTEPVALNDEQAYRLYAVLPDQRATVICDLALVMGLRAAEVAGVCTEDIDFWNLSILVTGKGGKQRTVPIPKMCVAELRNLCQASGPVIRSTVHPERGVSPHYISELVSLYLYMAGCKKRPWDQVSCHALRRTAATNALRASGDLRVPQQLLGHSKVSTTDRYIGRTRIEDVRAALEGVTDFRLAS